MCPSSTTSPGPNELPFAPLEPPLNPGILPLISRIADVQMELGEDAARSGENNHHFLRMCDALDVLQATAPGEHAVLPEVFTRVNDKDLKVNELPTAEDGSIDWDGALCARRARAQSSPKALRASLTEAPNAPKAPRASRRSTSRNANEDALSSSSVRRMGLPF